MRRYIRKPHYYELDKMGIMHHSNIIRIMEEARVDLLFQLGINIYEIEKVGIVSPVTKVQCDYISMISDSAEIVVEILIAKYTGILLELKYNIFEGTNNKQYVSAQSQHCFLRKDSNEILEIQGFDKELDQSIKYFMKNGYDDE